MDKTADKPDQIYATGNNVTGSWNASEGNPKLYPHQIRYLLATPARESADDLLGLAECHVKRLEYYFEETGEGYHDWQDALAILDKAKGTAE